MILQETIGTLPQSSMVFLSIFARMKNHIGQLIYALFRWKIETKVPLESFKKSVLIAAPHTSNWDLVFSLAGFWILQLNIKFFIKNKHTQSWYGWLLKFLGAIGVNRPQRNNLTQYVINLFNEKDQFILMVPAEGSRKRVTRWKTGFYYIAQGAGVPIALGALDYRSRTASVNKILYPRGNFKEDMKIIEAHYQKYTGKYPENFNPKIF